MQTNFFLLTKLSFITATCFSFLCVLPSCSPRIESRGNLPNLDMLANIEIGQVNKREVLESIGSPSTIELFEGESWYYISEKIETKAFFEPKVNKRKVIIIRFNKKGIVKEIKTLGIKDAQNVKMVDRVTPTAGQGMTVLKQIFGNIGRFEGASGTNPGPGE